MVDKEMLEAIGQLMDEKLEPLQEDVRNMQKDIKDLKTGQKNMIKRLAKIEAVQEYLIEHVDDLEQKNPA
jgi:hypothetical protein